MILFFINVYRVRRLCGIHSSHDACVHKWIKESLRRPTTRESNVSWTFGSKFMTLLRNLTKLNFRVMRDLAHSEELLGFFGVYYLCN